MLRYNVLLAWIKATSIALLSLAILDLIYQFVIELQKPYYNSPTLFWKEAFDLG